MSDRTVRILEEVLSRGRVPITWLSQNLAASPATIRRDLAALERRGLLRRVHGAAVAAEPVLDESYHADSQFQAQMQYMAEEKRRIGVLAARLVSDDMVIAFGAGTTTTQVARSLRPARNVSVITNSIGIAMELARRNDLRIFVSGGYLHGGWFSLTGAHAIEALKGFCIDLVFLSVAGIDSERGCTESHTEEAFLNRTLLRQARKKVVVADHTKIGRVAQHILCPLEEIDLLITDTGADKRQLSQWKKKGFEVQTA